jgi:hypothetical protein
MKPYSRRCSNPRCEHTMPAGRLLCTACWISVPALLRVQYNRAQRRGHGTPEHIEATRAVLKSIGVELQEAA